MKQQQTLFNILLLQQRKEQTRQIRPFFTATQQKLLWGCFWPKQGFFTECSAPSTAAKSGAEGTRWHQAARQRGERRCQAAPRASCLVADGEAFPAASQTAQPKHWPEGKCWLLQLGRSVWRGEIKMGKHGRSRQPKEINTHTTHK